VRGKGETLGEESLGVVGRKKGSAARDALNSQKRKADDLGKRTAAGGEDQRQRGENSKKVLSGRRLRRSQRNLVSQSLSKKKQFGKEKGSNGA